jgi:hypothetical protein
VPGNHLLYPEKWVLQLQALNGGGPISTKIHQPKIGSAASTISG